MAVIKDGTDDFQIISYDEEVKSRDEYFDTQGDQESRVTSLCRLLRGSLSVEVK
jgi:hypothetical protein